MTGLRTRPTALLPVLLAGIAMATSLGCSTNLSATAKGSRTPDTAACTPGERVEVTNGDFTIVQTCLNSDNLLVGDGILETTLWRFDFQGQDVGSCFPESAILEIHLRPTGNLIGERLRVQDQWAMGLEEIQSLDVGKEQTLIVDMMLRNGRPSPYTPSEIRRLILEAQEHRLPMVYELNALVSYAELTIHCRR